MVTTDSHPAESHPEDSGERNHQIDEEEFISRAQAFFADVGIEMSLGPDTDLLESGVLLDSLVVVAFVAFIEDFAGREIELDSDGIQSLATIRTALSLLGGSM